MLMLMLNHSPTMAGVLYFIDGCHLPFLNRHFVVLLRYYAPFNYSSLVLIDILNVNLILGKFSFLGHPMTSWFS